MDSMNGNDENLCLWFYGLLAENIDTSKYEEIYYYQTVITWKFVVSENQNY